MTAALTAGAPVAAPPARAQAFAATGWLVALLAAGAAMRSALGPSTAGAALAFSAVLVAGAAAGRALVPGPRAPARPVRPVLVWGGAGAAVLVLGPVLAHSGPAGGVGRTGLLPWAATVAVVVVAEETFLRGALWRACTQWGGGRAALAVTTVTFAGAHVPLYGWRALPLDLVVGLALGALRLGSGSVAAPAIAHLLADWAGWWLV